MSGDRARAHLYERLDEIVGTNAADALRGYLPLVGWADVATKHDLNQVEQRLDARIDAKVDQLEAKLTARMDQTDARLEALEHRLMAAMERGLRQGLVATFGAMVALLTIATLVVDLLR